MPRPMPAASLPVSRAVAAALACIMAAGPAQAYLDGPPDARCGNPPLYDDCTGCHGSFPLNSGDGILTLSGAPAVYLPDTLYTFFVTLSDPGQTRWGFELTVQDEAFNQAGILSRVDNKVRVDVGIGPAPDYAKHTLAGLQTGQPSGGWTVRWQAPPAGTGTAHVWWAGNAANADGTFFEDYIYTSHLAIPESAPASVPGAPMGAARPTLAIFPNPIRAGGATIHYAAPGAPVVRIEIYDVRGRLVRRLAEEGASARVDGAGVEGVAIWDGRDEAGRNLPSGLYRVALDDERAGWSLVVTRSVLLVR